MALWPLKVLPVLVRIVTPAGALQKSMPLVSPPVISALTVKVTPATVAPKSAPFAAAAPA